MRTHCTRTRIRTYYMFCTRTHAHTHCAHAHTPDVVNCSSERPAYVFFMCHRCRFDAVGRLKKHVNAGEHPSACGSSYTATSIYMHTYTYTYTLCTYTYTFILHVLYTYTYVYTLYTCAYTYTMRAYVYMFCTTHISHMNIITSIILYTLYI